MDIYIKPAKKASIANKDKIKLEDIAEVFTNDSILPRVKAVKLLEIKEQKKADYLISVIDIIEAVDKALPGNTISNVGEVETLVEYKPQKSGDKKFYKYLKIFIISLIIFMGASTAIISFHNDAQIPEVFKNYYKVFFGKEAENTYIIDIPYSIGLVTGIIVFFNHFFGKKITDDPTPIEVEISTYEAEVTDTRLDMLNSERIKKNGGGP